MPTYCTIPEATPLAPKKTKTYKGLVACAALAAFVLGTVAATALRAGGGAPKVVVSLSEGGAKCRCPIDTTQEYTNLRACLDDCHGRDDCVRDAAVGSRNASRQIRRRGEGFPQRQLQ